MMSLVSMKRKPEKKDDGDKDGACCPSTSDYERPDYPWGTRLTLEGEQLEALGLANAMPALGTRMDMIAVVEVVGSHSESVDGGNPQRRLELQITEMAVQPPGPSLHERMYGKPATAAT